ncbi:MAG: NAD/NADP octopine/nopaline dehydrogenase family protein [Candidatus Eremiobacteraeota bacterium]|nr:NAD/NADP octopine/nopaline dehydrogenase family protein [Candidatus Eremiobacteraeota bacterium]
MDKKITILGAGNGGHALAFHLSRNGCGVCIFEHPNFKSNLDGINQKGGIEAIGTMVKDEKIMEGKLSGFEEISKTTTDIKEAMDFSDIILMIVPSFAQVTMFNIMMHYLRDGHLVVLLPGNFGSMVFFRMMEEACVKKDVMFAETISIPHACRKVGPGQVFIGGIKDALEISALPAKKTPECIEKLKGFMPLDLVPLKNVLEVGFSNMNMIAHPATAILGMGPAEARNGEFYFYKEGMSDSVSKVQQKMDDERIEVGKKLRLHLSSFIDLVNLMYGMDVSSIRDFALHSPIHNAFGYDFPKSPRARYVSEDVPYILVPVYHFAKLVDVDVPAIQSIISIASIMNNIDYLEEGRTFEKMGLTGKKLETLLHYIQNGEKKK